MQVNLKRDWFAPNNLLFAKTANPNEIPEEFINDLPSDAEVVGEDEKTRVARRAKSRAESEKSVKAMKAQQLTKLEA